MILELGSVYLFEVYLPEPIVGKSLTIPSK
jgi:hypothetical protein